MEEKASIVIGEFTLEQVSDDIVYIHKDSGEGGAFEMSKLEEAIAAFYNENF